MRGGVAATSATRASIRGGQVAPPLLHAARGFSLIELVIVIVILGIIAAIAIPRVSRGAGNAGEAALRADLRVLRNGVEMFRAESPTASYPSTNVMQELQLYVHGIPVLSVPLASGATPTAIINPFGAQVRNFAPPASGSQHSWMYCNENGDLWANEPAYGAW